MKKTVLFLLSILATGSLWAQTPELYTGTGVDASDFTTGCKYFFLDEDANQWSAYYSPVIRMSAKKKHETIMTYHKDGDNVSAQTFKLPENHKPVFVQNAGNEYFATYIATPSKKEAEFRTLFIPKDVNGQELVPALRLSFDLDKKGTLYTYPAASPDGKMHGVLLVGTDKKSMAAGLHLLVYDENGNELFYKLLVPEIYGNVFDIADFQVNDAGEALILLRTSNKMGNKVSSTALQLITCDGEETLSMGCLFEQGFIHSMKVAELRNGKYVIAGYWGEGIDEVTTGFFHCFADPKTQTVSEVQNHDFPAGQKSEKILENMAAIVTYQTETCFLKELEDGSVMLIGEHRGSIYVTGSAMSSYWLLHAKNIVYEHFDASGKLLAAQTIVKDQSNVSNYKVDDKGIDLNYNDALVSFSPIVVDSKVYVFYTDSQKNFEKGDGHSAEMGVFKAGKTCLVKARLSDKGPKQELVMLAGKQKNVFHNIWHFDGKTCYFGYDDYKGDVYKIGKLDMSK